MAYDGFSAWNSKNPPRPLSRHRCANDYRTRLWFLASSGASLAPSRQEDEGFRDDSSGWNPKGTIVMQTLPATTEHRTRNIERRSDVSVGLVRSWKFLVRCSTFTFCLATCVCTPTLADDPQAQQDATIIETLLRLENFDLESSAKGKAAAEKAVPLWQETQKRLAARVGARQFDQVLAGIKHVAAAAEGE